MALQAVFTADKTNKIFENKEISFWDSRLKFKERLDHKCDSEKLFNYGWEIAFNFILHAKINVGK